MNSVCYTAHHVANLLLPKGYVKEFLLHLLDVYTQSTGCIFSEVSLLRHYTVCVRKRAIFVFVKG